MSEQAVNVVMRKRLTSSPNEEGYPVEADGNTEFEIDANDEALWNLSLVFGRLDIYLKSSAASNVRVHVGGEEG